METSAGRDVSGRPTELESGSEPQPTVRLELGKLHNCYRADSQDDSIKQRRHSMDKGEEMDWLVGNRQNDVNCGEHFKCRPGDCRRVNWLYAAQPL